MATKSKTIKNKDEIAYKKNKYYEENKDKFLYRSRLYYESNKEKIQAQWAEKRKGRNKNPVWEKPFVSSGFEYKETDSSVMLPRGV